MLKIMFKRLLIKLHIANDKYKEIICVLFNMNDELFGFLITMYIIFHVFITMLLYLLIYHNFITIIASIVFFILFYSSIVFNNKTN